MRSYLKHLACDIQDIVAKIEMAQNGKLYFQFYIKIYRKTEWFKNCS